MLHGTAPALGPGTQASPPMEDTMDKKNEQSKKEEIKLVIKKVRTGVKAGNWCGTKAA
jgi:hypothetical protein